MIHSMQQCLDKIHAIGKIAQNGKELAEDEITQMHFDEILQEVGYLEREAEDDTN